MTPLLREILERIANDGPMDVGTYMGLCLGHPQHGYYMTRDPFGAAGDFTTAPEISQMFGEMLGVWAASVWHAMGAPAKVLLVELGPGRGTLMADMLRAARTVPAFARAVQVHLVETSPILRKMQADTLAGHRPHWHTAVDTLPEGAGAIIIANEFFDALPVRQFVRLDGRWHERLIGANPDFTLASGLSEAIDPPSGLRGAGDGVWELSPVSERIMGVLAQRLAKWGGALLAVDYGSDVIAPGDTVQAVKSHAFVDPLAEPGEADVTAHVNFARLGAVAGASGATVHPVISQRALLLGLGIEARAAALCARHPGRIAEFDAAVARLAGTGAGQMGHLFKALAVSSGLQGVPPAFGPPDF